METRKVMDENGVWISCFLRNSVVSTSIRLVNKRVISVFAYIAFIVHFTDRFRHFFGELGCGVMI